MSDAFIRSCARRIGLIAIVITFAIPSLHSPGLINNEREFVEGKHPGGTKI